VSRTGPASRRAAASEQARGFNAATGFGGGDVDSINPFNGNLVIRIPIGQAYKVNGHLSYQLSLVYNNNVWDYQMRDDGTATYTQALPNRTSNAGLGWTVSLGRLNPQLRARRRARRQRRKEVGRDTSPIRRETGWRRGGGAASQTRRPAGKIPGLERRGLPSADDLDYMHARFFNPLPGRFTSVDPTGGRPSRPQSWNPYSYVTNKPLHFTDPDGLQEASVWVHG
jgi:RHS repeat-associated protein